MQVLPTWETLPLREPESRYGLGMKEPDLVLSSVLPNYFNFGLNVPVETNPLKDYFYLGAPALLGLWFLIRRRKIRDLLPALAILAATLILAINPFDLVWKVIQHSKLLQDILRSWYFLAGVTLAIAPLTAYGLDDFLSRKGTVPIWLARSAAAAMVLWGTYELIRWKHQSLAHGWQSGLYLLVTLPIFAAGLYAFRSGSGPWRPWIAAALIICAGADYKAFGTSKRFDAGAGDAQRWSFRSFPGMEDSVYRELRDHAESRIIVDNDTGPEPDDFRHIGLITPQGFDPFLTSELRKLVEVYGSLRTDRTFDLDLTNEAGLHLFGVRYVISSEYSRMYPKLKGNPRFRLLGSFPTFYKVYEYLDPHPPFSWEGEPGGRLDRVRWEPERRSFAVHSANGGTLALHEQFFPGWTATIDGVEAPESRWMGAFQAVTVPAGEHTVEFQYRSRLLALGGAISALALIGLAVWIRSDRLRPVAP